MKQITFLSKPARWALQILVWTAALAFVACDNDVNFNPVAPAFPNRAAFPDVTTAGPNRTLEILGSLTAEQGACIEATVLYDDEELEGGRAVCSDASGCAKLELSAEVLSTAGRSLHLFPSAEPVAGASGIPSKGQSAGVSRGFTSGDHHRSGANSRHAESRGKRDL